MKELKNTFDGWTPVVLMNYMFPVSDEIYEWLNSIVGIANYTAISKTRRYVTVLFRNQNDAILFSLTFNGKLVT